MSPRRRALGVNVALAAAVSLVLLAASELVLRRVLPRRTAFYQYDAGALYRPRPFAGQAFLYPHLLREQEVLLRFDAHGFRGGGEEPPPGALRVAVFGDSFVEARLTREEHTFPVRLAARLSEALGQPVAAVNAGASGYGPDQELRRMEEDLPALGARLAVVVIFAGNDAGDLVRNGLFVLREGKLEPNEWELDAGVRRFMTGPGWRGLALVRALRGAWRRAFPAGEPLPRADPESALADCRREFEERRLHPGRVQPLQADHYDADLALEPESPSALAKRALLRPMVARLRDAAAARRVPLLLVLAPHPSDATRTWQPQVDAARYPAYRRSALTDLWAAAARDEGVPCVDLFPSFWDEGRGDFYFPRDGHWNGEGQEVAARLAAARVVEAGWLR